MLKRPKNQEVSIIEILPHHPYKPTIHSHGEYDIKEEEIREENIIDRLTDHIAILANIGNQQHEEQHFEIKSGTAHLKESMENTITRISQFEFSMYPKKPLTLDQFNTLRKNITKIGGTCHANLHLLLSSFPVSIDNHVENCVIYVQCGKDPVLTTIAKKHPSSADAFQEKIKKHKEETLNIIFEKNNISYDPTIEFKTAGNMPVVAVIEICNDHRHRHGHGKNAVLAKIVNKELKEMNRTDLPLVSHTITSNSVKTYSNNMLTNKTLYVDPVGSKLIDNINVSLVSSYTSRKDNLFDKKALIVSEKYKTSLSVALNTIRVENPPFGRNYALYIVPQYKISTFSNSEVKDTFYQLFDKDRFQDLKTIFETTKNTYLQKKRGKKRKKTIEKVDVLFGKLNEQDVKKTDRSFIMLGALLLMAKEAQQHHSAKFFKKKEFSELYILLNTVVKDFVASEKLDVSETRLEEAAKLFISKK